MKLGPNALMALRRRQRAPDRIAARLAECVAATDATPQEAAQAAIDLAAALAGMDAKTQVELPLGSDE